MDEAIMATADKYDIDIYNFLLSSHSFFSGSESTFLISGDEILKIIPKNRPMHTFIYIRRLIIKGC